MSVVPRSKVYIPLVTLFISLFSLLFSKLGRGSKASEFEESIKAYWNVSYCMTISTWRLGFYLALKHLDLKKDDEVITTAIDIPDMINCISTLDLKPIFCDMDINTHSIDIKDLKLKITKKTKVIHLIYLSGIPINLDEIIVIAKENNLKIIEDISQSYGSKYKNKNLGTYGDIAIGSFSLGKSIASLAGGFLITNDEKMFNKINHFCINNLKKPNKKILFRILIFQILLSIATTNIIFKYITYNFFRILVKFSPETYKHPVLQPKFLTRKVGSNNFYKNSAILRKKMPDDIFFYFSDLQSNIAKSSFNNFHKGLLRRRVLANILFQNLDKKVINLIPKSLNMIECNSYWHFPILIDKHIEIIQVKFLLSGIDSVGYGIPSCNDISDFKKYYAELPNTNMIKKNTLFIPIHESFSDKVVLQISKKLNFIINEYY